MKKLLLLLVAAISVVSVSAGENWKKEISSNYFYIKTADGKGLYWDLPGTHPATAKKDVQFQIWAQDGDAYERTFTFPKINGTVANFGITNKAGFIVDVSGKRELNAKEIVQQKTGKKFKMKKDNGAQIQTWTIDEGAKEWQQWRLVVVNSTVVEFINVYTNKAIQVEDNSVNVNGAKLISYTKKDVIGQRFVLEYAEGPKKGQLLNFSE